MALITPVTTNLIAEYVADFGTCSDTACTLPITSGTVKGWKDNNGVNNSTNSTGVPLVSNAINGKAALNFNTSSGFSLTGTVGTQSLTFYTVLQPTARGNQQVYLAASAGATMLIQQNKGQPAIYNGSSTLQPSTSTYGILEEVQLIVYILDSTGITMRVNGNQVSNLTPTTVASITSMLLFGTASFYFTGLVAYAAIYNASHSGTTLTNIENSILSYYNLPVPNVPVYNNTMTVDGDSIAFGYGATDNAHQWDVLANAAATAPMTLRNCAVVGSQISNVTARSALTQSYLKSSHLVDLVFLNVETNDMFGGGASAATTFANLKTLCNATKTARPGCKICIRTCLPRNGASEVTRSAYNTLLQGDFGVSTGQSRITKPNSGITYADMLIDIGSDPVIGVSPPTTTNYSTDLIHLNNTGQAIYATYGTWVINNFTVSTTAVDFIQTSFTGVGTAARGIYRNALTGQVLNPTLSSGTGGYETYNAANISSYQLGLNEQGNSGLYYGPSQNGATRPYILTVVKNVAGVESDPILGWTRSVPVITTSGIQPTTFSQYIGGTVSASPTPTTTVFSVTGLNSTIDLYDNSFIEFVTGTLKGTLYVIQSYAPTSGVITLIPTNPPAIAPSAGDAFQVGGKSYLGRQRAAIG